MTNFVYDNTLPVSGNNPSVDQPNMTINTASIDGIIAEDHVGFNTNEGGRHNQCRFLRLGAKPSLSTDQVALYGKVAGTPAKTQLFYENQDGTEFQVTGNASLGANGYTSLFNDVKLQWGSASAPPGTSGTITFPIAFTTVYSVTIGPFRAANAGFNEDKLLYIRSLSTTSFTIYNANSVPTFTVYWMAIGN